jgi:hypothetical protein
LGASGVNKGITNSVTLRSSVPSRSLFVYLTDAIAAHARGDPIPTLT